MEQGIINDLTVRHIIEVKGQDETIRVEVESCYRNTIYAVAVAILNNTREVISFTWE